MHNLVSNSFISSYCSNVAVSFSLYTLVRWRLEKQSALFSVPFPYTKSNIFSASLHLSQLNLWLYDLARFGVIVLSTSPTADALLVVTLVFCWLWPIS